jgi:hypothetical protein
MEHPKPHITDRQLLLPVLFSKSSAERKYE